MTVRVRKRRDREGAFQVDVRGMLPDGTRYRERIKPPVSTYSAAMRWGQQREASIIAQGGVKARKEAPSFAAFLPRFRQGHVEAEGLKPSTRDGIESILRAHLLPVFGSKKLDAISDEAVARFKGSLLASRASPKTINNIVTVLSVILRRAVAWKVIDAMPCTIRLLKVPPPAFSFYEFGEYARLLAAAGALDPRIELLVLLSGDAGLRRGEVIALEWTDVDWKRSTIHVQRSAWGKHVTAPKGGRSRRVGMTEQLAEALRAHRHLRGPRVLCHEDGTAIGKKAIEEWLEKATRRAGLPASRELHALRHTYCSHLAMQGAPAKAIQELAGHVNLSTTLRYMHLGPAEKDKAVRLLDRRPTEDAGHQAVTGGEGGAEAVAAVGEEK